MAPNEASRPASPSRSGHRLLIVGAGPEAARLALELADAGAPVTLAAGAPLEPAAAGARGATLSEEVPLLVALRNHPGIELLEEVEGVVLEGRGEDLEARLRLRAQPVDPARCTACGACVPVCPVDLPGAGELGARRAVALPPPELGGAAARIEKEGRAPCRAACPIGVNAQGYVALAARGRFREALALVRERNPLPGICGRVCTHPCEAACRRGEIDEPVAICALKRFVADAEPAEPEPAAATPAVERPERVAVVGSGPAGIAAAHDLRRRGYRVTVFDALSAPGGLLRWGIPEYRLPKAVLDRELARIAATGVEFRTGERIGPGRSPADLLREGFDAVVLATGAPRDRRLGVPGEDLAGVHGCLAFLRAAGLGAPLPVGRRVAVVGGGNAAIDAARTAVRLGAGEVMVLYRRGEEEMPALRAEVEAARAEGVAFSFLTSPVAFLGDGGRLSAARCIRMALGEPDASGRRGPEPLPGAEHELAIDTVVLAVGQEGDGEVLHGVEGVAFRGGRIVADARQSTGHPRIFAAGDASRGPDSVIQAMADGQRAALAVHAALSREQVAWPDWAASGYDRAQPPRAGYTPAPRRPVPHLPPASRGAGFAEVESALREGDAIAEASRCLQCGACCECGACVAACGEARAIDHGRAPAERRVPLLGAVRLDPADALLCGAEHLLHDAGRPGPAGPALAEAILARLRADLRPPGPAAPGRAPGAATAAAFLCTCNGSVLRRDLVDELAAELAARPGVGSVRVVNAACQEEGAAAMAGALEAGAGRILLAACLCCPLGVVCGSCTHQRARCKENLLVTAGVGPACVETVNLRDEVLNQPGLTPRAALDLARRAVLAGLARVLAAPAGGEPSAAVAPATRRGARLVPVPLPGLAPTPARIDADLCRGCGTCARSCPQEAIALVGRDGGVPLARVEAARCTLCGTCLAVCPTGAPDAPFAGHAAVRAALAATLAGESC